MFVLNECTHDARVLKEATSLTNAGYDVTIIAVLGKKAPAFEERDGFKILRVPIKRFNWSKLRAFIARYTPIRTRRVKRLQPTTQTKAVPTQPDHTRWNRVLVRNINILRFNWAFFRKARQLDADIYHAHDLNTTLAAFMSYVLYKGQAIVYDSHELYPEILTHQGLEKKALTFLDRLSARWATQTITVNPSIAKEFLSRYSVSPAIIMNAPPLRRSDFNNMKQKNVLKEELGIDSDKRIVLYQGGFTPNRGLERLIHVAPYLDDDTVIVFMGWGPLEAELKTIVEEHNLQDKVYFHPGVPQNILLQYTACADVGVIPYLPVSLNNYYCTPNKLFEYIVAGIAVAASDLPELRRIIHEHQVGYTFDPEKVESIVETVQKALDDAPNLKQNTKAASKVLSWEQQEKVLLRIYESLYSKK